MEKRIGIEEIKKLYPDEWVLLGNPEKDKTNLEIIAGVPIYHSKDKREVAYKGKDMVTAYKRFTLFYTGEFKRSSRTLGLFKRISQ